MPGAAPPLILALDQGTTGSTALVVAAAAGGARVVGRGAREVPQHFPRPGWVEHDPEDLWTTVVGAAADAVAAAGVAPGDLAAVGLTNQRETAVAWDRATGRPVGGRAIVWQDRRTADRCAALAAAGHGDAIRAATGLPLDPYFTATKWAWLCDEGGLRVGAEAGDVCLGTVDSWIAWRLTGGAAFVTDPSNASRTQCFDLRAGRFDDGLCARFGVPRAALAEVVPSSGVIGRTDPDAFLGVALPIAGLAGDQQAALVGQGAIAQGRAKCTYGTGSFLLVATGEEVPAAGHDLLATAACDLGDGRRFALEAPIFSTGSSVQWLRDGLGLIDAADESEALARSVDDTGGVYLVPAFTGLGAPWWDPAARGALTGLSRGTGRAHVVRAALEAMAFQTRDAVEAIEATCVAIGADFAVDGGASGNGFVCAFLAAQLDRRVVRPEILDTTALGAAFLAGLAVGVWDDADALVAAVRPGATFVPAGDPDRDRRFAGWRAAVAGVRQIGS